MLDRCQNCGRPWPTVIHQLCGQDLCDPCLDRHSWHGCSPAKYRPTRWLP